MAELKFEWTGIQQKHRLYQGAEINIQAFVGEELFIHNHFADKHFSYYPKEKRLIYQDGKNLLCTPKGMVLRKGVSENISFEKPGDSINFEDGGVGCILEEKDLRELLENSFFLSHQQRFYDFIKDELLLLKW